MTEEKAAAGLRERLARHGGRPVQWRREPLGLAGEGSARQTLLLHQGHHPVDAFLALRLLIFAAAVERDGAARRAVGSVALAGVLDK